MCEVDQLADRVRHERLRRGWSVRDAAAAGSISNTYWGKFEDYRQSLTPMIATAVAKAFDWPADWPDAADGQPVNRQADEMAQLRREVDALRQAVESLLVGGRLDAEQQLEAIRASLDSARSQRSTA